ncbi:Hypothetical protein PHPALM_11608 [Phytophthora palmivora]|uniref:Uncharacterized protein n=1 Tax=Phytophthora palmivora TaxID=4796 RepID=A0A2P4Y1V8_9STRA|nr:Hypothetical protein PHPALM_11608 [Phytophthora palmivora]
MPNGVTTLLSDLGPIDGRDMILDTGSGVCNIVTQVVLGTSVHDDEIAFTGQLDERAQFFCHDVSKLLISYTPPLADATIVYWNNVLFDSSAIKVCRGRALRDVHGAPTSKLHKLLPETPRTLPQSFLRNVRVDKRGGCSEQWKAKLLRVFVYMAKAFE